MLDLSRERDNALEVFSIRTCNAEGKIIGHLPKESVENHKALDGSLCKIDFNSENGL